MNFREIEKIENAVAPTEIVASSLQLKMLAEYLEKEKRKSGVDKNPFMYFYEDIISSSLSFNFKEAIGDLNFKNASEDALTCLNTCNEFHKLSSWIIAAWLPNALKFADYLVLHYIQDCCKEVPKSYPKAGIEKARYIQLSENENNIISPAGAKLKELYDLRNKLEHRTETYPDGKQKLISPKRNQVRSVVKKLYPSVLKHILETYKSLYPLLLNSQS